MTRNVDQPSFSSRIRALKQRWWVSCPASKRLILIAIGLWLLSIPLPGLVTPSHVSDLEIIWGYQILFSGWMGIFGFVFPWYANLFFFYVCWRLLRTDKLPLVAAKLAFLTATSMFLYSEIPSLPNSVVVFGYGWGAFLWYSAILLAAVSVAVKRLEQNNQYQGYRSIKRDDLGLVSGFLLISWIGVSLFVGIKQKLIASETERNRLYRVVFERGSTCTTPDYKVHAAIPLAGALQVTADIPSSHIGLASPANLVSWGIPIVRKGRFDYYRSDSSLDWHLVAGPPMSQVFAKLVVERTYDKRYLVRARLTSADENIVAFDAKWLSGIDRDPHYCPGYFPAAKENEPPRNLLLTALIPPGGMFNPPSQQKLLFEGPKHVDMLVKKVLLIGKTQRDTFTGNMGCPDDVGLRHLRFMKAHPSEQLFVPPSSWGHASRLPVKVLHEELDGQGDVVFQAHDHFHFMRSVRHIEVSCSGQNAYLGWGHPSGGNYPDDYLYIQKRTVPHFQKVWPTDRRIKFQRSGETATVPYAKFHIYSVSETEHGITIVLAYFSKDSKEGDLIQIETEADTNVAPTSAVIQKQ